MPKAYVKLAALPFMSLSQAAENYPACRRSDESVPFRLRVLNSSKKILLIGHSGGAAMTALLASRFPASADAYLLATCPCDVPQWQQWRQWRNASAGKTERWRHSLSPQDEVGKIKASTRIALVVGNRDDAPATFGFPPYSSLGYKLP